MSFRQRPATTIYKILKKSDAEIQKYVNFVFTSHPNKVDVLRTKLKNHLAEADKALSNGEAIVTNGIAGFSASKEEARQKLYDWAYSAMLKQVDQLIGDMKVETSPTISAELKAQQDAFLKLMTKLGTMYVLAEVSRDKARLALAELNRLETETKVAPSSASRIS